MKIGILKEVKDGESRVVLTPTEVKVLSRNGHSVLVEKNAGLNAGFPDQLYLEAGAEITQLAKDIFEQSDMVVKVKEISPKEYALLQPGQILFSCLHPAANKEEVDVLLEKKVVAITAEDTHRFGSPNCEVAGKLGALMGIQYLLSTNGGLGKLVGGVGGVPGIQALVLGGGIVGKSAVDVLASLRAQVRLLDINIGVLREAQFLFPKNVTTGFSNQETIKEILPNVDLVINCVKWPKQRADHLITREMLCMMQKGSVIVDISADVGGAIETYRPTTFNEPVYTVDGVIHFGVDNIPGAVPNTASIAYAASVFPHIHSIANNGVEKALIDDEYLRKGLTAFKGVLTHEETGNIQERQWVKPEELLN
ncbi:alanine dehydrogenase [Bacillus pakistanensis]|uniref:alanine dehydrogenase n=1 Tax=Rossellomorea pakistanensis TaxID=992288 RepID=A0ABS2NEK1_9BACI|nr:alanine dehydrogenase [Bacillus pakistanensis]MBM7586281.1 alanine dehydrogenase [Bacillus pakistanensis]